MSAGDGRPGDRDGDPLEHDVDLAWELFEAQPRHPEVGRLAQRVLAQQPGRNGIRMLLAMHLVACDDAAGARALLHDIAGQRDPFYVDAARELRDLELAESDFDSARQWAEAVLREEQDNGRDLVELGAATALSGDLEAGWALMDDGVALCARTGQRLDHALMSRAVYLMQSWAPPERFVPAAEAAMQADPSAEFIGGLLGWAYLQQGRFRDAEDLALRLLRIDPTDGLAAGVLTVLREWQVVVDRGDVTFPEIHASGIVDLVWAQKRDELLGTDLVSALAALETVLPADLRAALRPPLDDEAAAASPGEAAIAAWHDGQEPGTGHLWGVDGGLRLLSSAEVAAMDEAIEADPSAYPGWEQNELSDHYVQVMTDDTGGYLIETLEEVVVRRSGADDVVVAATLADWFWGRVSAFGGRDPRPAHRRSGAVTG